MNRLVINYHATGSVEFVFSSPEALRAAYDKISVAMRDFGKYRNDKQVTVSIEDDGGLLTLNIERINTVTMDSSGAQALCEEFARWKGALHGLHEREKERVVRRTDA